MRAFKDDSVVCTLARSLPEAYPELGQRLPKAYLRLFQQIFPKRLLIYNCLQWFVLFFVFLFSTSYSRSPSSTLRSLSVLVSWFILLVFLPFGLPSLFDLFRYFFCRFAHSLLFSSSYLRIQYSFYCLSTYLCWSFSFSIRSSFFLSSSVFFNSLLIFILYLVLISSS